MGVEKPFGWRRRIGLISPTVIEMISYDFYRMAPAGLGLCGITSNIEFWDKDNFGRALDSILEASTYLSSRHVDFIIHAGMPLVTTRGKGFEDELVKKISEKTGLPATTSIRSAIRALAHLGIKRVALLTPYPQELHRSAKVFLEASGFEVVADKTMDVDFKRLQDVLPEQICSFVRQLNLKGADGIYIPCNQWAGCDAAPLVELDLGLPVVTGGHADFWEAFRSVGVRDRIEGHGRLMGSLADMPR
jgi:maleate cis-trans isomerase